ncbi:NIPSNAP family protein [Nitratireductor sp. ZSWI3]|uniref:NIPSNAP family protein n=1 Tax=Nitratireductor sp. ZSWI3 TaxID=2966359 RepID=UPI00215039D5|nr:NIPSNAP family protein [Nitratireductor sp. ZSWI3]MCR4265031.1 NIPSNAP family protein [Nitratireductor sp. ZSWI3]
MLHELRIYELRVDGVAPYLKLFETVGLPIVQRYMKLVGYWRNVSGNPNGVTHLWAHESFATRQAAREGLANDAEWRDRYLPRALPLIERQHVTLLQAMDFSPIR